MYKVLFVEDEFHIRRIVKEYFLIKGIEVIEAANGLEALQHMNDQIDLILLDIMMPGMNGYEICKEIRSTYKKPIIFISALSQDENQIKGYSLGADDYITKPFKPEILCMKVLAMIKRNKKIEEDLITIGQIKLDKVRHELIINDERKTLKNKEYQLMLYLCNHQNQILPREQILNKIWGYDYFGDLRAVDTYIKKLRRKLGCYSIYQNNSKKWLYARGKRA